MTADRDELLVPDVRAWADWLSLHHNDDSGSWVVLAKKGALEPTSLTYDEALAEALCQGWIDGQKGSRDESTFVQRFTPRRPRSSWSKRNVQLVEDLIAAGRMKPAGMSAVLQAQADGRWEAAYAGQATMEVPADLLIALQANPRAQAMFGILSSVNRYAICLRVTTAKRPETRARKIDGFIDDLAKGQTPYPQTRTIDDGHDGST